MHLHTSNKSRISMSTHTERSERSARARARRLQQELGALKQAFAEEVRLSKKLRAEIGAVRTSTTSTSSAAAAAALTLIGVGAEVHVLVLRYLGLKDCGRAVRVCRALQRRIAAPRRA